MQQPVSGTLLGTLEAQFAQHDSAPPLLEIRKVPFVIGRAGPDGFVDSKQKPNMVSRQHCQFVLVEQPAEGAPPGSFAIKLVDLQSRNGTVVQSRRVENIVLRDGDLISFGGASAVDMGAECQGYSDVAYKFRYPPGHPVVPISVHTAQPLAPKAGEASAAKGATSAKAAAKAKATNGAAASEGSEKPSKPERGKAKPSAAPSKRAAKAAAKKAQAETTLPYAEEEKPEPAAADGKKQKRGVTDGLGDLDNLIVAKRPRNAAANAAHVWKVGDVVEAKCQNPALKERNAWFDAIVCAVNGAQRGYRVQYQGYDHSFDEDLTPACVRPVSNGEYDISDVTVGQTVLCRHKNGWWYDAKVLRLLQENEPNPDPTQPLFRVRWVDKHVPSPQEVSVAYEHCFIISH